jgi:hypothetical protein
MKPLYQPTQPEAITALVAKSKRQSVPIRWTFLQQKGKHGPLPGPLCEIVRNQDKRAFDLYLLVLLVAAGKPHEVIIEAAGWARALGIANTSGLVAVSRTWKRLADLNLITRGRKARKASITLLREDGSGAPYVRPRGRTHPERYLRLPLEYWTQEWYRAIGLPAKAMLLIALSLQDRFYLPIERAKEWYGLSADTAQRGLAQLEDVGLLGREVKYKPAPLTSQGWTEEHRYTLKPPFGPRAKLSRRPKPRRPEGARTVAQTYKRGGFSMVTAKKKPDT